MSPAYEDAGFSLWIENWKIEQCKIDELLCFCPSCLNWHALQSQLIQRLEIVWQSKDELDNLRGGENHIWFRLAKLLPVAEDALGFYQYPVKAALTLPSVTDNLAESIVNHIAHYDDAWTI